jgi:hypothetical protein
MEPKLNAAERYVVELLRSRYGVSLSKIDERGGKGGRTPDFRYPQRGRQRFAAELKEFPHVEPSEATGWTVVRHSDVSVEATRISNATSRISSAISEAHSQLMTYSGTKVLIFLNHSSSLSVDNLQEVYRGYRPLGEIDGVRYVDVYARRASEGHIKAKKAEIDLYIWIESGDGKRLRFNPDGTLLETHLHFLTTSIQGKNLVERYFPRHPRKRGTT